MICARERLRHDAVRADLDLPDFFENFAGDHALAKRFVICKFIPTSRTEILEELRRMPEAERRELIEEIDLEFGDFDDTLTPEQKTELDRRAREFRKNPSEGIPFEQVREEARKRFGWKTEDELIDQRLQEHRNNPEDVASLEEVKAKLDAKYRK
jgi:putative addiction module component (TIGR02574 family)